MSPLVHAQSPLHYTWSTMTHCCGLHLVEKESAMTTFEATFTTALGGAAVFTNLFWERCRKQRVMSVLSALCLLVSTDTISWGYLGLHPTHTYLNEEISAFNPSLWDDLL